jgi:hypothetical protein
VPFFEYLILDTTELVEYLLHARQVNNATIGQPTTSVLDALLVQVDEPINCICTQNSAR